MTLRAGHPRRPDGHGTAEQVAEKIAELYRSGIDGVLLTFLEFHADVIRFGKEILPLLRQMGVRRP